MANPDIFLSYSREDAARAKQLAEALAREGFEVWWDAHLRSGEDYDKVTEEALKTAKAVAVLWSKKSVESRWVRSEAAIGLRNGTLAPAMIEPCDRPVMFELVHTAELSHWQGSGSDKAWHAYVEDLRKFVGMEKPAVAAATETRKLVKRKPFLIAAAAVVLLALSGSAWFALGSDSGIFAGSEEPIPVLVHGFAAVTSGNADEAALATGITDELINRLRRVPGLMVASGRDLAGENSEDGRNSIEGNVRLIGEQVRVSVRLADPKGNILWSENFDRELTDLLTLQEEIARAVAGRLSVSLDVGINSREYGGTNNPEAFAHFIQGNINYVCLPDCANEIGHLERAVALDAEYVAALGSLSVFYGFTAGAQNNEVEVERRLALAGDYSSKAFAARPDLYVGNAPRIWYLMSNGETAASDTLQRKAATLDTGDDPTVKSNLALFAAMTGRVRKALEIFESRELIDPIYRRDPTRVAFLTLAGHFQEATALYEELSAADPRIATRDYGPFGNVLASWAIEAYLQNGQEEAAAALARNLDWPPIAIATVPNLPPEELKRWAAKEFTRLLSSAVALGRAGRHQEAAAHIDLAYRSRRIGGPYAYLWIPSLAGARKTKTFAALVTHLGLMQAWRESGEWSDFCHPVSDTEITCK